MSESVELNRAYSKFTTTLLPEWIDFNNHLNDAAYAKVLSEANEEFFAMLDLSAEYRKRTGCSPYTVDLHISYKAEVKSDETLSAHTRVIELTPKKIRVVTELLKSDGSVCATGTTLYLHYDSNQKAVTALTEEQLARISEWFAPHEAN